MVILSGSLLQLDGLGFRLRLRSLRPLDSQGPLHDHQRHDLEQRVRGGHGGQLGIRVVGGGDLDEIGGDEIDALEPPDDGPELPGGPAAGLRGAGRGREGRVQGVDVDGEVDGVGGADAVADGLDDAGGADAVDVARLDPGEAAVAVVVVVAEAGERGADAGVDAAVVGQQALLRRVVEVRAVVDGGLLAGRAAKYLRLPRVEVRVKVDDGDGAVGSVDAAQEREGDGVVAPEGDDSREGLAVLGDAGFGGGGVGLAHEEAVVAVFDLLDRVGVIVAGIEKINGEVGEAD